MQSHQVTSFLGTYIMSDPHGEILGLILTYSNIFYNYFVTSFVYINNHLYNPMFGNGEYGNN